MKKGVIFLGLFFLSCNVFSQTIKRTLINRDKNLKEEFYVLNSDTLIKQGKYIAHAYFSNVLICEGFYKNNLKDSTWKYFGFRDEVIDSGNYKADKKIGIWTAWDIKKKIQLQYDYGSKKLVAYDMKPEDTSVVYNIVNGAKVTFAFLQRPPIYIDGSRMLKETISRNLDFTAEARENKIGGKVFVSFLINDDGHVSDYKVLKSPGYGLDKSALNAVKQLTGDWLPGLLNGKPVAVEYMIPVEFAYGN